MTILEVLAAIEESAIAHAISKTDHLVGASLQILHVLGLILFLGSLVLIGLRASGRVLADQSLRDVICDTSRAMWLGLALVVLSGMLMFVATPRLYFFNTAFGWKMGLMVFAGIAQAVLFRKLAREPATSSAFARAAIVLSVASWFAVAMAGRMIGFI